MIEQFVEQEFIRLDGAFPSDLAETAREILWKNTRCDPAECPKLVEWSKTS